MSTTIALSAAPSTARASGPPAPGRERIIGVDVVRGLALFGMMAVHVFPLFNRDGGPSLTAVVASGRSATMFAFVAGISLAFLSGRRRLPRGRRWYESAAGIAMRGVVIALIGLVLAYLGGANVILSAYGLMFLLAIPLLGRRPRSLAILATAIGILGPVLLVATAMAGLTYPDEPLDPTLTSLVEHPMRVLRLLLLTGNYPIVVYFAFLCAGLAVGRLDLTSRRTAWSLLGGGAALAATAQAVSMILLYPLGAMARLVPYAGDGEGDYLTNSRELLWDPSTLGTWDYLALPSPHSGTPFDVAHTLGSAMAVLGLALLLTRLPVVRRLLRPIADAGSMPLTIYSAHLVVLSTDLLWNRPRLLFLIMVAASVGFAVLWRRGHRQGPLEGVVAWASGRARRVVSTRLDGLTREDRDGGGAVDDGPERPPAAVVAAQRDQGETTR